VDLRLPGRVDDQHVGDQDRRVVGSGSNDRQVRFTRCVKRSPSRSFWAQAGHGLPSVLQLRFTAQAAIEAITVGLALGLIDIHSTGKPGEWFNALGAFFLAGSLLGLRHGTRAWQAWAPLGFCFYAVHRAAIAYGYQPPYVEEDAESALRSFFVLWPAGIGLGLGALVSLGISFVVRAAWKHEGGSVPRAAAPRDRAWFTVARLMLIIALIAINLTDVRMLLWTDHFLGFGTVYAPGYSEDRFQRLRVGMTASEVEAIVGRPLGRSDWGSGPTPTAQELWQYSSHHDHTANFWRRWALVENGKVVHVFNDFWVD
jgi:hypothetical protein